MFITSNYKHGKQDIPDLRKMMHTTNSTEHRRKQVVIVRLCTGHKRPNITFYKPRIIDSGEYNCGFGTMTANL